MMMCFSVSWLRLFPPSCLAISFRGWSAVVSSFQLAPVVRFISFGIAAAVACRHSTEQQQRHYGSTLILQAFDAYEVVFVDEIVPEH